LLKPGGKLYFEINEQFSAAVSEMLEAKKYHEVQPVKDMFDKDRFVKATFSA